MSIPPNVEPLSSISCDQELSVFGFPFTTLICPICGFGYNHPGTPRAISGDDNYDAWSGRGDLTAIPFSGECGSQWELCLGFHKGHTACFVRVRKSCTTDSFLYFIEAKGTGFVKIGRSSNPERRLSQLATGSPNELILLGTISGGHDLEQSLHQDFSHLRGRGEWFNLTPALHRFIRQAIS